MHTHLGYNLSAEPRTKRYLTNDEVNNYWAAYFIVTDGLSLCREKLQAQENSANEPAGQNMYRAARLNVEAQLELMQTMRFHFNDGRAKVTPPSAELIRNLAISSAKVSGFAGDPSRLSDVIEMTTAIFTDFQKLQEL